MGFLGVKKRWKAVGEVLGRTHGRLGRSLSPGDSQKSNCSPRSHTLSAQSRAYSPARDPGDPFPREERPGKDPVSCPHISTLPSSIRAWPGMCILPISPQIYWRPVLKAGGGGTQQMCLRPPKHERGVGGCSESCCPNCGTTGVLHMLWGNGHFLAWAELATRVFGLAILKQGCLPAPPPPPPLEGHLSVSGHI